MNDQPQGPGWWQASDLKWYPPQPNSHYTATLPPPQGGGFAPQQPYNPAGPPENHMGLAIATTVVTFLLGYLGFVPGVVSLVNATKVNRLWTMHLYDDARRAAKKAKTWIMVSWAVAVIEVVVFAVVVIVLPDSSIHQAIFHSSPPVSTGDGGGSSGVSSPGKATVSVGGQRQDITGPVTCSDIGMGKQIGIGAINIMLGPRENPLDIMMIQFPFTSTDGVTGLEYNPGDDGAHATGSKDGNSYKFTGVLEGTKDNSSQGVTRDFEIDATCP